MIQPLAHKVKLENYCGPLDLLLHLVREGEMEIIHIQIAEVALQYCAYLQALDGLNLEIGGEFLVMASTLMEMKAMTLVPRDEASEEEADPRLELIQKLLEYKKFKDLARGFGALAERQSLRFQRGRFEEVAPREEPEIVLDSWKLCVAYAAVLKETLLETAGSIVLDEVPIEEIMEAILTQIKQGQTRRFGELLAGVADPRGRIGHFLALLELAKQGILQVRQEKNFSEILIERALAQAPPAATAKQAPPTGNSS